MKYYIVSVIGDVFDVHGKDLGLFVKKGKLIFVDLDPYANWAHPCCYYLVGGDKVETVYHDWPPRGHMEEL